MSRKDFELIAAIIAAMPTHAATLRDARTSCARAFSEKLAAAYPRFNAAKFLIACGVAP